MNPLFDIEKAERQLEEMKRAISAQEDRIRKAKETNRNEIARRKYEHDPRIPIAIQLHKLMCHHNHTDQCGWEYDHGKWNAWDICHAHKLYLKKATNVITLAEKLNIKTDDVLLIIKTI